MAIAGFNGIFPDTSRRGGEFVVQSRESKGWQLPQTDVFVSEAAFWPELSDQGRLTHPIPRPVLEIRREFPVEPHRRSYPHHGAPGGRSIGHARQGCKAEGAVPPFVSAFFTCWWCGLKNTEIVGAIAGPKSTPTRYETWAWPFRLGGTVARTMALFIEPSRMVSEGWLDDCLDRPLGFRFFQPRTRREERN